jgi:cell pole-organizing protein PopZ
MTPDTGGIDAGTRDSVISEETSTTATAALTELARAANARDYGDGKPKSDADRILEQLVREALRPQLKAWLDENLPGLVEKVVRQEIRRISQRAEATAESESDG